MSFFGCPACPAIPNLSVLLLWLSFCYGCPPHRLYFMFCFVCPDLLFISCCLLSPLLVFRAIGCPVSLFTYTSFPVRIQVDCLLSSCPGYPSYRLSCMFRFGCRALLFISHAYWSSCPMAVRHIGCFCMSLFVCVLLSAVLPKAILCVPFCHS
jgi:hypothetical protein